MGLDIVNRPWTTRVGTVRGLTGPVRPNTTPVRVWANSGGVNSLTCTKGYRTAALRVQHGPRTGPVGYEKHWRFPCGARTLPSRASHGVPMDSCESFDQTISVQLYGFHSMMWPREQRGRKIPTGASFGYTGIKSYGWLKIVRVVWLDVTEALRTRNRTGAKNSTGNVVGCDWGITHPCVTPRILATSQ